MTAYQEFLADNERIEVTLLEVRGRNVAADTEKTYYFSSERYATGPTDSLASQRYDARIVRGLEMSSTLGAISPQLAGLLPPRAGGSISVAQQFGDLDRGSLGQLEGVSIRDISFGGRQARVLHGGYSPRLGRWLTYDEFKVVFSGTCDGNPQIDDTLVTFGLSPKDRDFEYPLATRTLWGLGYAGHFDGTDDSIDFGAHAEHNFTSGDFTLSLPFYYESNPGATARFWNRGTAAVSGWQVELTTSGEVGLRTSQSGASQVTTSAAIPKNRWVWLHLRRVGATVSIFVDGEPSVGSSAAHIDPASSSDHMFLGQNAGGTVFTRMMVGEARIWNVALTKQQINDRMHRPLDSTEVTSSLVFYARLNEGSGSTAADSSATGATGTISGMTWVHSCTGHQADVGHPMPDVFGPFDGVSPVQLDFARQIFLISGEQIDSVTRIETGGAAGMAASSSSPYSSLMDFLIADTDDGEYDTCIVAGGSFVRFGDQPFYPPTVVGTGNAPGGVYLETAAAQARWLVCNRGPNPLTDPTDLYTSAFTALDSANSAPIASAWEGDEPLSEVLAYILRSVGAVGGFRRADDLFTVKRINGVAGETPVALRLSEKDVALESLQILGRSTPVADVIVRYARNYTVLDTSQITPAVLNTAREAFLRKEWRTARRRSAAVRADYQDAVSLTIDTGLSTYGDAIAETARLATLFAAPDQAIRFLCRQRGVELDRLDTVYFHFSDFDANGRRQSRYGTSEASAFLVAEVGDDAETGGKWITLWREST